MKNVIVSFDAPKVSINGMEFECMLSPMELQGKCRKYMTQLFDMDVEDETQIRDTIAAACDIVDDALGGGAMVKIAAGKPVSLPAALKVLNAIISATGSDYREYVRREYMGERR